MAARYLTIKKKQRHARGMAPERAIGKRIRAARLAKGLTQKALAVAAGISEFQTSRIECGLSPISVQVLRALAAALDVSTSHLLGEA